MRQTWKGANRGLWHNLSADDKTSIEAASNLLTPMPKQPMTNDLWIIIIIVVIDYYMFSVINTVILLYHAWCYITVISTIWCGIIEINNSNSNNNGNKIIKNKII